MRVKRAQTRAAEHAASDNTDGPDGSASAKTPLKRSHTAFQRAPPNGQKDESATNKNSTKIAKHDESKEDGERVPADSSPDPTKRINKKGDKISTDSPTEPESKATSSSTHLISPSTSKNPIETMDSSDLTTKQLSSESEIKSDSANKKRPPASSTKNHSQNKKTPNKCMAKKDPPARKDKKLVPNKELKNLDIQIAGYGSVFNAGPSDVSSETNIKASISEIVKTKSRSSATHSLYSKTCDKAKNTDKPEGTPQAPATESHLNISKPKVTPSSSRKSATPKKPQTQTSKISINKRTPKGNTTQSAQLSDILSSPNVDGSIDKTENEVSNQLDVIPVNETNASPKTDEAEVSKELMPTADTTKPQQNETKPKQKAASVKRTKTASSAKPSKPRATQSKRKPAAAKPKNPTLETATTPATVYSLQTSDSLPFVNSPNFSDPDTVTSPMVAPDPSDTHSNAGGGHSGIRKMVADILVGLEMSDDVLSNDKPFDGVPNSPKSKEFDENPNPVDAIDLKPVKLEKISVKSIESMTSHKQVEDIKIEIKKELPLQTKDEHEDKAKMIKAEEISRYGSLEKPISESPGTEPEPTKKNPQSTKSCSKKIAIKSKPTIPKEAPDSSKDIYDFHESGHSSEDASVVSYIKSAKKDDIHEETKPDKSQTKSNKTPDTEVKKQNEIKSNSSKKTANRRSDQSDADSSDSSDNKVLATKIASKPANDDKRSGASSDSDSGSDTSVRTPVNNRRKKSAKDRCVRVQDVPDGPKRSRMASLNASVKVRCLYENEQRTAQELGFVREPRVAPKVRLAVGSDNPRSSATAKKATPITTQEVSAEKDGKKKDIDQPVPPDAVEKPVDTSKVKADESGETTKSETVQKTQEVKAKDTKEPESSSLSESESEKEEEKIDIDAPRALRMVPGLRGVGKLWEMGNMSSFQSDSELDDDETYDQKPDKPKQKKKAIPKRAKTTKSTKADKPKAKPKPKTFKRSVAAAKSSSSSENDEPDKAVEVKPKPKKKYKKKRIEENTDQLVIVSKRKASVTASAMLAASYEVERHLDMDSLYNGSSADSESEAASPASPKKIKEVKVEVMDDAKETRPLSTNVVIVQDTDVTITGVYVNSKLGSSQEAYCKMQYRVQSSVTEERMVMPGQEQPPKSYTPLSALSCMLPPGSGDSALGVVDGTPLDQPPPPDTLSPPMPSTSMFMPHQPAHHMPPHYAPYPPHMHMPHMQQQPPPAHHLGQQPPQLMAIHRGGSPPPPPPPHCESPFRYEQMYAQPPHPPPPVVMGQSSSAFCAIGAPQSEASRYYQPAGPLITSHMVAGHPGSSKSGLDAEPMQLLQSGSAIAQSQPRAGVAENPDAEVLIADRGQRPPTYLYAPRPPPPGSHGPLYARPIHQMHCPPYPPASYYTPYQQHPPEVCYSPTYQTAYYPPKVYPSSYHRYVPNSAYYQPGDVYSAPPTTTGDSRTPPSLSSSVGTLIAAPDGAGHSGHPLPPHMDHYAPAYYATGYSPGGGQCYNRSMPPPYLDSSSYPSSCPCPMQQSFPKNVLTGPLIGSKPGKGPGQSSNPIAFIDTTSGAPLSSTVSTQSTTQSHPRNTLHPSGNAPMAPHTSSVTPTTTTSSSTSTSSQPSQIPFKQEKTDDNTQTIVVVVKPEHQDSKPQPYNMSSILQVKSGGQSDADHGRSCTNTMRINSMTMMMGNTQMSEPELSVSPARGSVGLQTPPAQDCAVQPIEMPIVRRARLGKSMARELISQKQSLPPAPAAAAATHTSTVHQHHSRQLAHSQVISHSANAERMHGERIVVQPSAIGVKHVKQETVKIEIDDDVVCLEKDDHQQPAIVDLCQPEHPSICIPSHPRPTLTASKRKSIEPIEILDVDTAMPDVICTTPTLLPKKPKILEVYKSQAKKSPPNSYKNLIKPSAPKPYLCNADGKAGRKSRFRFIRGEPRFGVHQREVLLNGKHRKLLVPNGRAIKRRIFKAKPAPVTSSSVTDVSDALDEKTNQGSDDVIVDDVHTNPTPDTANETTAASNHTNSPESSGPTDAKTDNDVNPERDEIANTLTMSPEKTRFMSSLDLIIDRVALGYFSDDECVTIRRNTRTKLKKHAGGEQRSKSETSKKTKQSSASTKETFSQTNDILQMTNTMHSIQTPITDKPSTASTPAACVDEISTHPEATTSRTSTAEETTAMHTTDDSIFSANHNNNNDIDFDDMSHLATKYPSKPTAPRKSRSRGAKFSNRKRHKVRQAPPETEEVLAPRKSNATPRWSNGWSWQGESFQGKVFLNSDDPQVVRRMYSSMVHDGGDVIRPGDCVLLRSGGKKNELPYVAKVASLWENPEDGEMMMSLFWYYRPEHTEQGRLPNHCPDEVFASRHQDHNSVACIEDKCYVLTFNEYCRYRKSVKALEEGIVPEPSHAIMVIPHLNRDIPATVNSELVLFCRRVYEFRLKRLVKNPT